MSEVFKTTIRRVRDIFRVAPLHITGMDSMYHICFYLMARSLTIEKCDALGIEHKYAWEVIFQNAKTAVGGRQAAIDIYTTPPSLTGIFDEWFGTTKFTFGISDIDVHINLLHIFNTVDLTVLASDMDYLGWVYEQHLQTGSGAARDMGQFFTDRPLCDYCIRECAPKVVDGVPESVCDPTMGTGGFLVRTIKQFGDVDWEKHNGRIHGCDADPRVAMIARLNVFIEMGCVINTAKSVVQQDSLYNGLPSTYDVILANVPFGLKGLIYENCCDAVKAIGIKGTKSEPLFLQLLMTALNRGGRCAVVMPDGVLANNSTLHNKTRRYLVDHFELRKIIKFEGKGFFMNTSIEPSVMFFENTGSPTKSVEFWNVSKDATGAMTETLACSVDREKLDAACSFDMRRYMETEKPVNYGAFPTRSLRDVCIMKNGTNIPTEVRLENGPFPYYGSNGVNLYVERFNFEGPAVLIGDQGSSWMKSVKYIGEGVKIFASNHTVVMVPKDMQCKFLYYYLNLKDLGGYSVRSALIPQMDKQDFNSMPVPLPPLDVQTEIVASLDRIYGAGTVELSETLKLTDKAMALVLTQPNGTTLEPIVEAQRLTHKAVQMAADIKVQMAADIKFQMAAIVKACGAKSPTVRLGDISVHQNGKTLASSDKDDAALYNVMGGGMSYNGKYKEFNREGTTISVSKSGASAGFVMLHHDKYWAGDCFTVSPKDETVLLTKFLFYFLKLQTSFKDSQRGTTIPHCDWNTVKDTVTPLPPLDVQTDMVARLDALQTQLDALEALQRQSDSNARYILEAYLGAPAEAPFQDTAFHHEQTEAAFQHETPSEGLVNELVLCKRQKMDD